MDFQLIADIKNAAVPVLYLISAIFFIFGIKRLSHPKTATGGNFMGAIGMLLATITALIDFGVKMQVEHRATSRPILGNGFGSWAPSRSGPSSASGPPWG
jgi:NAD/NADP transhydrogenase beta subunit